MANNTTTQLTIRVNGREVERTLNGMGNELRQLNREVRNMNESDPNFNERVHEIRMLRREYNGLREDIYGANNATNNFTEGLKGVGAGIVAAFSVDKVMELTKALYDNVERVRQFKAELSSVTGLDGSQLSNATTSTISIAQTFKKDEKEIMISANNMSKTIGITYADALEELKRGFKEGADASGDMLEQVKEYAPFIKEAGGEAKDLINIIKSGVQNGVYNDKAIDAVKEGLLRIREMTPATRDAITNLGLDVNDMLDKIKSGQMSYMDAMMLVSKEMDKLGNKSTVTGQALADIFGGPGEDAGFKYISNLYKMNDGVKNLSRAQLENNRIKELELQANEKSAIFFEQLTDASSGYNEILNKSKLAAIEFASALFGIKEATPADDILNEATAVKMLENELFRTNTTAERRNEIINELGQIYPGIFDNLNTEIASNLELQKAIDGATDSLMKRYAIQQEQDIFDEISKDAAKTARELIFMEKSIDEMMSKIMLEHKIKFTPEINTKEPMEQAKWLVDEIDKLGKRDVNFMELNGLIISTQRLKNETQDYANELQIASDNVLEIQNRLNKTSLTPLQKKTNDFLNDQMLSFQKIITDGQNSRNTSNADPNRAADLKRQAKEVADAQKRAQKEAENAAKKITDERIREAKSLHEALIKEKEAYYKKLNDSESQEKQAGIDLLKDGLDKEIEQQKFNSEKKILAVTEEINQINKLKEDYLKKAKKLEESAKNSGKGEDKGQYLDDAKKYRDLAQEQIRIVANKNSTITALNKKSTAEQLIIYSKYRAKEVELSQKASDDFINAKKIEFNEELTSATTLEGAKTILRDKYGVEELNHITTLTDARNELMKEQNKVMLQEQLGVLETEMEQLQSLLNDDAFSRENGLQILTDEDRDKQIENLKQLGLAISEVKAAVSNDEAMSDEEKANREKGAKSELRSGIDILGFSAEDWEQAFEKLDTAGPELEKFAAKIAIVEMAIQSVMAAWGMMADAQNKALDRNLKKYEQSNEARKKSLQKQLDSGLISQESYNAQVEALDEALAAKRAEMEYKKAMTEWKMNLISSQINTALAVTKAVAASPTTGGLPFSAIVGAIGLLQTGLIQANKPNKSNFYYEGGPTIGLGYRDETGHEVAGTVHAGEYVVPEWLREDPVVAKMEEFIEAKRRGNTVSIVDFPAKYATGGEVQTVATPVTSSSNLDQNLIRILIEYVENGNQLLAILKTEGVKLTRTMEGAKQLSEDIDYYKTLINKSKKS